jgi:hypothetical protein
MSSKKIVCGGITNRLNDGKDYVTFLEWDKRSFESVQREITFLMTRWDLNYGVLLDSHGDMRHFHFISPTIVSAYDYLGILWDSTCDMGYKKSFFRLGEKSLRITPKHDNRKNIIPKVIGTFYITCNFVKRKYSKPHCEFLKKYYLKNNEFGFIRDSDYIDGELELVTYKTKVK